MTFSKTYKVDDMRKLLLEAALELPEPSLNQLWLYHRLLRKANPSLNLSRIYNFENMVRKHYIDSLFVHKIFKEKSIPLPSPLLDIGSGPGLPGFPWRSAFRKQNLFWQKAVKCGLISSKMSYSGLP